MKAKTRFQKAMTHKYLICGLSLGSLMMWLSPCHADFATPFAEANNKLGEVSTAHGYLVAVDSGFLVVVRTDTMDHVMFKATAGNGVVGESLLGREVVITARIAKAGSATTQPELEIVRIESLNPKAGPVAPTAETLVMEGGTVELPQGFKHTADDGEDSAPGHFTSHDGAFVIRYDHGKMAGVYATSQPQKPIISRTEVKAGDLVGLMVVYGEAPQKVVVSFPKGGPANFFAEVRNKDDIETVRKLATSFRVESD